MLLRLIAENITSFKDAVEFNTFPMSKTKSHSSHKVECGHVTCLRLSAIYGANGTGKRSGLRVWFRNIFGLLQSFYPRDRIYAGAVPPGI